MKREDFIKLFNQQKENPEAVDFGSIINKSLEADGKEAYTIIVEELAELAQQVTKCKRGIVDRYDLLQEAADAWIVMQYLYNLQGITDRELMCAIEAKLIRNEAELQKEGKI